MKCSGFENFISPHLDGELTKEEAEEFETHMEQCSSCRKLLMKTRALVEEIDKIPVEDPPIPPVRNIILNFNERSLLPISRFLKPALAGLAIVLLVIIAVPMAARFFTPSPEQGSDRIKVSSVADIPSADKSEVHFDYSFQVGDVEYQVTLEGQGGEMLFISVEDETERMFEMEFMDAGDTDKCNKCNGTGKCHMCGGTGIYNDHKCNTCNGTGECFYCNGDGKLWN